NYAIAQARGNWIAFLDADEYFVPEDVPKLMRLLDEIQAAGTFDALVCSWSQLTDENIIFEVNEQVRLFRNLPGIRYTGKIHETLTLKSSQLAEAPQINIMHTGYTQTAFQETGKGNRNIILLREALQKKPDDADLMAYLADSLIAERIPGIEGRIPENVAEAERLHQAALDSGRITMPILKQKTYFFLLQQIVNDPEKQEHALELSRKAIKDFPECPDFSYLCSTILNKKGEHESAWEMLLKCEETLNAKQLPFSKIVLNHPAVLFSEMLITADKLKNTEGIVKYATILLRHDKSLKVVLALVINLLCRSGARLDELIQLLKKLYDFNSVQDKLVIARAAKDAGHIELAKTVLDMITEEERAFMSAAGEGPK
ncbi:MAG: glycosyltransferase, partial [Syntrophaceae bacterium]|nr:glycosyltransferase [Syntrophaceae bacterium]